jgi:hypothetical protein
MFRRIRFETLQYMHKVLHTYAPQFIHVTISKAIRAILNQASAIEPPSPAA